MRPAGQSGFVVASGSCILFLLFRNEMRRFLCTKDMAAVASWKDGFIGKWRHVLHLLWSLCQISNTLMLHLGRAEAASHPTCFIDKFKPLSMTHILRGGVASGNLRKFSWDLHWSAMAAPSEKCEGVERVWIHPASPSDRVVQ